MRAIWALPHVDLVFTLNDTTTMIIWKDIPAVIRRKISHYRKKIKPKDRSGGFVDTYGEIPVVRYNTTTKKFEDVVNPRGNAYATRNRLRFRKGHK